MSKYTTELRYLCETLIGLKESVDYASVSDVISQARPIIFNFDYPIFDQNYKSVLETKILKHYYTREIGSETYGLWKLRLDTKMNEIMPYYNQLYDSQLLTFNPLYDKDLTTTGTRTDQGTNSTDANTTVDNVVTTDNNNTVTGKNVNAFQETPQNGLMDVESLKYLSTATIDTTNSSDTGKGTQDTKGTSQNITNSGFNSLNDYAEHVAGMTGARSGAQLLKEFRETFLNIDLQIIAELKDLFMLVY